MRRVGRADETIATCFSAWNELDAEQRRRMLEESVTGNVELVDPMGVGRESTRWASGSPATSPSAAGTAVAPAGAR